MAPQQIRDTRTVFSNTPLDCSSAPTPPQFRLPIEPRSEVAFSQSQGSKANLVLNPQSEISLRHGSPVKDSLEDPNRPPHPARRSQQVDTQTPPATQEPAELSYSAEGSPEMPPKGSRKGAPTASATRQTAAKKGGSAKHTPDKIVAPVGQSSHASMQEMRAARRNGAPAATSQQVTTYTSTAAKQASLSNNTLAPAHIQLSKTSKEPAAMVKMSSVPPAKNMSQQSRAFDGKAQNITPGPFVSNPSNILPFAQNNTGALSAVKKRSLIAKAADDDSYEVPNSPAKGGWERSGHVATKSRAPDKVGNKKGSGRKSKAHVKDECDQSDDEDYRSKPIKAVSSTERRATRASKGSAPLLELSKQKVKVSQKQIVETYTNESRKKRQSDSSNQSNSEATLVLKSSRLTGTDEVGERRSQLTHKTTKKAVVSVSHELESAKQTDSHPMISPDGRPKQGSTQEHPVTLDDGGDESSSYQSSPPSHHKPSAAAAAHSKRLKEQDLRAAERAANMQKPNMIHLRPNGPANQGTSSNKRARGSIDQNGALDSGARDPQQPSSIANDAFVEILTGSAKRRIQRADPEDHTPTRPDDNAAQLEEDSAIDHSALLDQSSPESIQDPRQEQMPPINLPLPSNAEVERPAIATKAVVTSTSREPTLKPTVPHATTLPNNGRKRRGDDIRTGHSKRLKPSDSVQVKQPLNDLMGANNHRPHTSQRRVTDEGSPVRQEQEESYTQQQNEDFDEMVAIAQPQLNNSRGALSRNVGVLHTTARLGDIGDGGIISPPAPEGESQAISHADYGSPASEDIADAVDLASGPEEPLLARREQTAVAQAAPKYESQTISHADYGSPASEDVADSPDLAANQEEVPFAGFEQMTMPKAAQRDEASFVERLKDGLREKAQTKEVEDDNRAEVEDPDTTLIGEETGLTADDGEQDEDEYKNEYKDEDYQSSQSSEISAQDRTKVRIEDEFEERTRSLHPYQRSFFDGLVRLSHDLFGHLMGAEDAVGDIVKDYHKDCLMLIEDMEESHRAKLAGYFEDVLTTQKELGRGFEIMTRHLEADMKIVEESRAKYSKEMVERRDDGIKKLDQMLQGFA